MSLQWVEHKYVQILMVPSENIVDVSSSTYIFCNLIFLIKGVLAKTVDDTKNSKIIFTYMKQAF